jgi:hypothetical protein
MNPEGLASKLASVLRSPWGRGKRRTEAKLNKVKINERLFTGWKVSPNLQSDLLYY